MLCPAACLQPWPIGRGLFNQLMIGCLGTAENDTDSDIVVDKSEWWPTISNNQQ